MGPGSLGALARAATATRLETERSAWTRHTDQMLATLATGGASMTRADLYPHLFASGGLFVAGASTASGGGAAALQGEAREAALREIKARLAERRARQEVTA